MANQDAPFGLRPLKTVGQQDDSTGFSSHTIDAGEGSAMYQGSVVNATTTGFVDISANDAELNLGAFWRCFYVDPTTLKPTFKNYYPGSITPPSGKDIEALFMTALIRCLKFNQLLQVLQINQTFSQLVI